MNTLPDSVVQHLTGFLTRCENAKLARTSKHNRGNSQAVAYEVLVYTLNHWDDPSDENGWATAGYEKTIYMWTMAEVKKLVAKLKENPMVHVINVYRYGKVDIGECKVWAEYHRRYRNINYKGQYGKRFGKLLGEYERFGKLLGEYFVW